jgi:hypothetical protein
LICYYSSAGLYICPQSDERWSMYTKRVLVTTAVILTFALGAPALAGDEKPAEKPAEETSEEAVARPEEEPAKETKAPEKKEDDEFGPLDIIPGPTPEEKARKARGNAEDEYRGEIRARLKKLERDVKPGVRPKTWQLKIEHDKPRRLIVGKDWRGNVGDPYIYLMYRITNPAKKDLTLKPSVELRTDRGTVYETYSPRALRAIQAKERKKFKSMFGADVGIETNEMKLAAGETKQAIAIFQYSPVEASKYDFVIYGLDDRYLVKIDETDPVTEDKKGLTMYHRLLKISYERPGDEFQTDFDRVKYLDTVWIEEEFTEGMPSWKKRGE